MDEDQYRSAYNELNPNRCIFEKAITNQRCDCELKHKFVLATREGVACQSKTALQRCTRVLDSIRHNARFSLKVTTIDGPMPHNKELQVQAGGILALQQLMENKNRNAGSSHAVSKNPTPRDTKYPGASQQIASNIHQTISTALLEYQQIDRLPYGEIVKGIVNYQSRPKRHKK